MPQLPELLSEATVTIGGKEAPAAATFEVVNPATEEVLGAAPAVSAEQLDAAVTSAHEAFGAWRRDEDARRAALVAAAGVLEANAAGLAALVTAEQGKPLHEATMEIYGAGYWLRYYASLGLPAEVVQDDENGFAEIHRRPLGVVAAITAWNFPVMLAFTKAAPALRAGNTVVVKPSPYTPLATLAAGALLRGILPDGVLNVISGPDPLGAALTAHPLVRKVSFTGSTATGKKIAQSAASDLKRLTLELGGNDPAVILPGTDISKIAADVFSGGFLNNGQTCAAIKRVYAHESQYDDVVAALAEIARQVKVGEGNEEGVQYGPLISRPQLERVAGLVADAVSNGAQVAAGGQLMPRPGYFYQPTILAGLSDGAAIVDEEQFGPALPVIAYQTVPDAVDRANHTHFGLTASVWADDPAAAARVAAEIDAGQVSVNGHATGGRADLPFGGHKWSGIGVENGPLGLHSFTETQVITGPRR